MTEALHKGHTLTFPAWCYQVLPSVSASSAVSVSVSNQGVASSASAVHVCSGLQVCWSISAKWDLLGQSQRLQAKILKAIASIEHP